jgi:hypothetical protein
VIMDRARADLLLQLDADVLLPAGSLYRLLVCLVRPPAPAVTVGSAVPDPAFAGAAYRASGWHLKVTHRYASWLPETEVRAEAAFWGSWASLVVERSPRRERVRSEGSRRAHAASRRAILRARRPQRAVEGASRR